MALLFLAGWLRFYDLSAESLWFDEAHSENFVKANVIDIVKTTGRANNNPPLYWVMLHYWVGLFGNGEGSLRSLSAIFGTAAVLVMFLVGSRLFDSRTAFIGALLFAVSPFQVYYSQEARPYGLLVFLSLASYLFFVKIIKPDHRRSDYLLYALSTIALGYTHVYAIFIIASQIGYLLIRGRACHHERYRFWAIFSLIVVCLLPLALILGPATQKIVSKGFWIQRPTLLTVATILKQFAGGQGHMGIILGALFISLSLLSFLTAKIGSVQWATAPPLDNFIRRCRTMAEAAHDNLLLILWLFVPIIVPFIISQITTPMLVPRYTIGASPAFYLLTARGIRALGVRMGLGMIIIIIVVTGLYLRNYYRYDVKEQWREAAEIVSSNAQGTDVILICGRHSLRLPFTYYYKGNLPIVEKKESIVSGDLAGYARKATQERSRLWVITLPQGNLSKTFRKSLKETLEKHPLLLKERLKKVQLFLIDLRSTQDKNLTHDPDKNKSRTSP
jgi:mannosyltransferase